MTSGNIAVFDHDAWRFTDFVCSFNELFGSTRKSRRSSRSACATFLATKKPGQPDSKDLLEIKKLIRETEARAGALAAGVPPEQLVFMDLRFYRTGTIAKAPIHPEDIEDIVRLFKRSAARSDLRRRRTVRPARHASHLRDGDLRRGAPRPGREGSNFEVWLYRGAWEEWEPHEIERVVPLSPERSGAQEERDLSASIAKGPGNVPRRHGQARILAACRGPQSPHREGVRPARACRSSMRWRVSCSGGNDRFTPKAKPMVIPERLKLQPVSNKLFDEMSALCDAIERELESGKSARIATSTMAFSCAAPVRPRRIPDVLEGGIQRGLRS